MIATKTNLEITEYREKFFLGLSLRQLACFAAAAVLAIATCFVCLHWLRMDMQVVSYIVMVEVLPFLGMGFIHRDGYPFEKLVKIYWACPAIFAARRAGQSECGHQSGLFELCPVLLLGAEPAFFRRQHSRLSERSRPSKYFPV